MSSLSVVYFLVAIILFLSGCKAYRNIENFDPRTFRQGNELFNESALQKLIEGDKIRIVTTSGIDHHVQFSKIEEGKVKGLLSKTGDRQLETPEYFELDIGRIEKLEVYRKSPALTAVAIYIPVASILAIILLSSGAGMSF